LLGELFKALGPVDRTAAAQFLEQLERRPVLPQLPPSEFHALQVAPDRCHEDLRDSPPGCLLDTTGWLARMGPPPARRDDRAIRRGCAAPPRAATARLAPRARSSAADPRVLYDARLARASAPHGSGLHRARRGRARPGSATGQLCRASEADQDGAADTRRDQPRRR